jgi:hypothetical protein
MDCISTDDDRLGDTIDRQTDHRESKAIDDALLRELRSTVPLYPVDPAAWSRAGTWYWRANAIVIVVILLALGLAKTATVVDGGICIFGFRLPEMCASKLLLGRSCMGCGLSRSLVFAAAGQWAQSLAIHPSGLWLGGILLCQLAVRSIMLAMKPRRSLRWRVDLAASLITLFVALYIPMILVRR